MKSLSIAVSSLALALVMVASPMARAVEPFYTILDLTPDGYTSSIAYDINSDGGAVGVASRFVSGTAESAYFYYDYSAGTSTVFGIGIVDPRSAIVGTGYRRAAMNDDGDIAGTARFLGGVAESRGFIYSGGVFTDLGTLAGATATGIRPSSDALDINNLGIATGTATSGAGTTPTEFDNIDVYVGSTSPVADIDGDITVATRHDYGRALNDAGLVAGQSDDTKAATFSGATEVEFLTGTSLESNTSFAIDLNEVGQVIGQTIDTNESFIYDIPGTTLTIVPQIGTGARMNAKAINELGDVVGHGDKGIALDDEGVGFVYTDGKSYVLQDQVVDLTVPTVTGLGDWGRLLTAWGVNDSGWIVGEGERRFDGESFPNSRAYLLIPTSIVPEPSTVAIASMMGLLLWCSRSQWNNRR